MKNVKLFWFRLYRKLLPIRPGSWFQVTWDQDPPSPEPEIWAKIFGTILIYGSGLRMKLGKNQP